MDTTSKRDEPDPPRPKKTTKTQLPVYLADGFAEDCNTLIQRFLKSETLSYEVFTNIWKDMNFAYIFQGRMTGPEVAEMSEEVVLIAKEFMVAPHNTFEEAVAGLFLLYACVNLQPYRDFASIRLLQEEVAPVLKLKRQAEERNMRVPLYMLGTLLVGGHTQFQMAPRPYGMERPMSKYHEQQVSLTSATQYRGVLRKNDYELQMLRDVGDAFRRYTLAKRMLPSIRDRSLTYLDDNFPAEMERSLKKLFEDDSEPDPGITVSPPKEVASDIKKRAMTHRIGQMKHLVSVADSSEAGPSTSASTSVRQSPKKKTKEKTLVQSRLKKSDARKILPFPDLRSSDEEESHQENDKIVVVDGSNLKINKDIRTITTNDGQVEIEVISYIEKPETNTETERGKSLDVLIDDDDVEEYIVKENLPKIITDRNPKVKKSTKTKPESADKTENIKENSKSFSDVEIEVISYTDKPKTNTETERLKSFSDVEIEVISYTDKPETNTETERLKSLDVLIDDDVEEYIVKENNLRRIADGSPKVKKSINTKPESAYKEENGTDKSKSFSDVEIEVVSYTDKPETNTETGKSLDALIDDNDDEEENNVKVNGPRRVTDTSAHVKNNTKAKHKSTDKNENRTENCKSSSKDVIEVISNTGKPENNAETGIGNSSDVLIDDDEEIVVKEKNPRRVTDRSPNVKTNTKTKQESTGNKENPTEQSKFFSNVAFEVISYTDTLETNTETEVGKSLYALIDDDDEVEENIVKENTPRRMTNRSPKVKKNTEAKQESAKGRFFSNVAIEVMSYAGKPNTNLETGRLKNSDLLIDDDDDDDEVEEYIIKEKKLRRITDRNSKVKKNTKVKHQSTDKKENRTEKGRFFSNIAIQIMSYTGKSETNTERGKRSDVLIDDNDEEEYIVKENKSRRITDRSPKIKKKTKGKQETTDKKENRSQKCKSFLKDETEIVSNTEKPESNTETESGKTLNLLSNVDDDEEEYIVKKKKPRRITHRSQVKKNIKAKQESTYKKENRIKKSKSSLKDKTEVVSNAEKPESKTKRGKSIVLLNDVDDDDEEYIVKEKKPRRITDRNSKVKKKTKAKPESTDKKENLSQKCKSFLKAETEVVSNTEKTESNTERFNSLDLFDDVDDNDEEEYIVQEKKPRRITVRSPKVKKNTKAKQELTDRKENRAENSKRSPKKRNAVSNKNDENVNGLSANNKSPKAIATIINNNNTRKRKNTQNNSEIIMKTKTISPRRGKQETIETVSEDELSLHIDLKGKKLKNFQTTPIKRKFANVRRTYSNKKRNDLAIPETSIQHKHL